MKLFTIFALLVSGLLIKPAIAERNLIVAGEEWPPFEFTKNGEIVGLDVDIATVIFKKLEIDVEFRMMPWTRVWGLMEQGQVDAIFSTSRKKQREPYVWYPHEGMWNSEYVFFVRKDKKQQVFNGYADAKKQGLSIGILAGNTYNPDFWNYFPVKKDGTHNQQIQEVQKPEQNFKKLLSGRIDLYIIDKTVGLYILRNMNIGDKITYYETPLFSKGYTMPFSKKSKFHGLKNIADRFEQGLIELKNSGEYDRIRAKWLTNE